MAVVWHKTNFLGVRYREHATRKHGVRPDRCFSIRYKVDGKDKEEVVGWSSEKMTAEKAFGHLSTIRENIRNGEGPRSMAEMRQMGEEEAAEQRKLERIKAKEQLTFADFWETEYLPSAEISKGAYTVTNEKGLYANWLALALADIPMRKITPVIVENIVQGAIKAGKSPATVRHIMALISQVWSKATARNVVQGECPTRRVKKPRQDNRRTRFLTRDEAKALLDALAEISMDTHDSALLALFCGMRAGEIHALAWGDVDLPGGTILIRDPKNKHNRHAFITSEVKAMLSRRHCGQSRTEYVFPAANGKQRRWVSDTFARTVNALGYNNTGEFIESENGEQIPVKIADARQRVVFHTLRHTFASWLVQDGTPLYTVAELMGHTTLEMTRRYSHLAPDSLRKAAMSLQGKLEEKSTNVIPFKRQSST